MSKEKDILARLRTALARSAGNAIKEHPPWRGPSVLSRRNEAKRGLLRDAITEIERLRAANASLAAAATARPMPAPVWTGPSVWSDVPP